MAGEAGDAVSKYVKGWSTKYALTEGVHEVTVEVKGRYAYTTGRLHQQLAIGKEFFTDYQAAVFDAEWRAEKKIKSLKKQIEKLEKLAAEPKSSQRGSSDERP